MSELIAEAEFNLEQYLQAAHDALQGTLEDAMPQSTLAEVDGADAAGHGDVPDTLRQRLEWEQREEMRRIRPHVVGVLERLEVLRRSVIALGGGEAGQPSRGVPVVDVPVESLDREIAMLSEESSRLGNLMIERYTEAQELAASLEAEIMDAQVPPL